MHTPSAKRLRTIQLQERTFRFAKAVIDVYVALTSFSGPEQELWSHLIGTCASVVSNLEEADEASSDADFIAKMKITLRETRECKVRIRLLVECRLAGHRGLASLQNEALQLASIFAAILINTKRRVAGEKAKKRTDRTRLRNAPSSGS
jgi:four helix bundle protein